MRQKNIEGVGIYIWKYGLDKQTQNTQHTIISDNAVFKDKLNGGKSIADWMFDAVNGNVKTYGLELLDFPAYWNIPEDVSNLEFEEMLSEITQIGNDTIHYQTNKFLHQFLQIHKLYKQNALEEETYRTVVSDLLSHVRD